MNRIWVEYDHHLGPCAGDTWLRGSITATWGFEVNDDIACYVVILYTDEVFYQLEVPGTMQWQPWQAKPAGMSFHEMLQWLEVAVRMQGVTE